MDHNIFCKTVFPKWWQNYWFSIYLRGTEQIFKFHYIFVCNFIVLIYLNRFYLSTSSSSAYYVTEIHLSIPWIADDFSLNFQAFFFTRLIFTTKIILNDLVHRNQEGLQSTALVWPSMIKLDTVKCSKWESLV